MLLLTPSWIFLPPNGFVQKISPWTLSCTIAVCGTNSFLRGSSERLRPQDPFLSRKGPFLFKKVSEGGKTPSVREGGGLTYSLNPLKEPLVLQAAIVSFEYRVGFRFFTLSLSVYLVFDFSEFL